MKAEPKKPNHTQKQQIIRNEKQNKLKKQRIRKTNHFQAPEH